MSCCAGGNTLIKGENIDKRLRRWQSVTAWPIILLSFIYIAVYVIPIYFYPLSSGFVTLCHVLEYSIWAVFVLDYSIQIVLAPNRSEFFRREWLALLLVAIPFFRPIRAIRGVIFIRQASTKRKSLVKSLPLIIGSMAVLMVLISGAAVLNAERFAPGSTIRTPSDALWWALTTLTTSGSGRLGPVTNEGRIIAAFLLIFGLGVLASMTGYVASWVLHQFNTAAREEDDLEHLDGGVVIEGSSK